MRPSAHRVLLPASLAAVVALLALSAWGYWQYASAVPSYRLRLPPPPVPNGYDRALAALARVSEIPHPPVPRDWPEGTSRELKAQLLPHRAVLAEVRAALKMKWQGRPELTVLTGTPPFPDYARFRGCARSFAAEAVLARQQGDFAQAMENSLDAMELASKMPRGGGLMPRLVALAVHDVGYREGRLDAPRVPATAAPAALARIQRIRANWPPLADMWEEERIAQLARDTEVMQSFRREPLRKQFRQYHDLQDPPVLSDTVRMLGTPRRWTFARTDAYFRRLAAESRKPFRQRRPVPVPDDVWCRYFLGHLEDANAWKFERQLTQLALLEAALAVRVHRLTHGRYPMQLSEIERRRLPAVPKDQWDQPVAYRLRDGKPVLYSLGPDGKDDGGRPFDGTRLQPNSRGDLVFGRLTRRLKPPGG